ncbi:MAG: restriction endonuclease [Myxococcales bacterium]|nr:restriction endonuclease [Myxococcales bacterium]MBK7196608.1 restriction endonuclease [Myxococcales bacterium]MBP6845571.1 restriction endonuclease [Kofleriaceae bacterium]
MANKSEKSEKAEKSDKAKAAKAPKPASKPAKADKPADKPAKAAAKPASKPASKPAKPADKPAKADKPAEKPAKGRGKKPTAAPTPVDDVVTEAALAPVEASPEVAPVEAAGDLGDLMMEDAMLDGTAPEPPLTAEEQELAAIYGDDLAPAPAAAAHAEFSDSRTADEDRPMLPEINGRQERQKRWEERRDQRRARRDFERNRRQERSGGRHEGPRPEGDRPRPEGDRPRPEGDRPRLDGDRPRPEGDRPRGDRPAQLALPAPAALSVPVSIPSDATGVVRVGNALGDAAWQVFTSIRGAQPMPVKQLAGMMRKRGLLDVDPEQAWPHLKAALLGDERSYRALGLRPRIVYRGRDLFAPGPVAQSATADAEAALAQALSSMAVATHATLKARIGQAGQAGFERLVHAFLIAVGYQEVNWIKRTEAISYATAVAPGSSGTILISARAGDAPVDRRGVGELRVGVEAKGLLAGHLFAARELSTEAERELERPGRSISVYAGDGFVTALLTAGVGVVTAAAPVRYVDDQLFGELLAG